MLLFKLFDNPLFFLIFMAALVVSITVHEFAHAWTAVKSGDHTPEYEGRLTLNPLAHLDMLGTIFLLVAGFGWGKPVPINPRNFHHKSDELLVAFSGIIMNIFIAFLFALPLRFGLIEASAPTLIGLIFVIIVQVNIILAAFNLLPIPPLDGSHLIEYFLKPEARYYFQYFGPYILLGVILLSSLGGLDIISTLMSPIMRFLTSIIGGGSFLSN